MIGYCEFGYGNRKLKNCSDTQIVKLFKIFVFNRSGVSTKIGETRDKMFICVDQRYFLRHQRGWCIWEPGMSQWRERLPPTNVTRVRFRPGAHMWVEFLVGSRLAPKIFLRVLRFSSLHKNQHFQIPTRPGQRNCMKTS